MLVVGAGIAGLSAAIHLLEQSHGGVNVDLIFQGHLLGGKATSWSEGNYLVGHGFHVVFGFYKELLALLTRSGAVDAQRLVKGSGKLFVYEERDRTVHTANGDMSDYTGFSAEEQANLALWGATNLGLILDLEKHPQLDEMSFDDWARSTGLAESLVRTNFFRYARDVIFNYPEPVSAYVVLEFLRAGLQGASPYDPFDVFYANGDMVECFIQPLADYFVSLGGKITQRLKVRRLLYSGSRISGVEVAEPDPPATHCASGHWPEGVIAVREDTSYVLDQYDGVVLAMPCSAFAELNPSDREFWSEASFAHVDKLQSAESLSCRFWCRSKVGTEQYDGILNGMPEPVPTVMDFRNVLARYADSPWESVLDCCGPLKGYEEYDDDALLRLIGERIASVPGLSNPLDCDLDRAWLRRNTGNHGRLVIPVPGSLKYRPYPSTQFDNLTLAGDWIRNSLEIPTMEGAARAGRDAASKLLARLG